MALASSEGAVRLDTNPVSHSLSLRSQFCSFHARPPHVQFPPTTTLRAAGDGTIVTTASDSPFEHAERSVDELHPAGARIAL